MSKLAEASKLRILSDRGFKQVAEDIKLYSEKIADRNRISLKEKTAKEKQAEKDKLEARTGRPAPDLLDNADESVEELLIDDLQLQESLKIAADYSALKTGGALKSMTIPEVDAAEAKRQLAKKNKDAKKIKK